MCFHVSLYISLALLSLAANRTTPDPATRFVHILNHGLGNLILQSWKENTSQEILFKIYLGFKLLHSEETRLVRLFVVSFDVASQCFPVLGSLSTIAAVLLQAVVNLHMP